MGYTGLGLLLLAFFLGAVPFSYIVGRCFLGKDIRNYGDGNPGAANVFRAGGKNLVYLAVALDVAKGFPVVYLAHHYFDLSSLTTILIAFGAVLGHAWSPFLRGHGGKAVAVSFGTMLALPDLTILYSFIFFIIIGALFISVDAWGVVFAAAASLAFHFVTGGMSWAVLFLWGLLFIFIVKHYSSLRCVPGLNGRLVRWISGRARGEPPGQ